LAIPDTPPYTPWQQMSILFVEQIDTQELTYLYPMIGNLIRKT
jgi:hypothetical protein